MVFFPSTAAMAREPLVLALLLMVRAPPAASALITRSLLALIVRVPALILLSAPPLTFLMMAVRGSLMVLRATTKPKLAPPALVPEDWLRETANPPAKVSMLLPPLPRAARASIVTLPVAVKSLMLYTPAVTPPEMVLKLKAPAIPADMALLAELRAAAMATPAASATIRDSSLRRARIVASTTLISPVAAVVAVGSPMRASTLRLMLLPVPAPTKAPLKAEPRAPEAALAEPAMA